MRISVASLYYWYFLIEHGSASLSLPVFVGQYGVKCKLMICKLILDMCQPLSLEYLNTISIQSKYKTHRILPHPNAKEEDDGCA